MFFGPVVTNAKDIYNLLGYKERGKYDAIKVITGWGLDVGWNTITRAQVLALTPNPIVRTTVGDPSNKGTDRFLNPDKVIAELREWLTIKPNLMVEVGNEPNIAFWPDNDIWAYRFFLNQTIDRLKAEFPWAHIIAPALIINEYTVRWLEITADVMRRADSIGVHVYEHYAFIGTQPAKTNQYQTVQRIYPNFFPGKKFVITEMGINDPHTPKSLKHKRYRELLAALPANYMGAVYYHINNRQDIDPQYHIPVDVPLI